ncbi:PREDICTED: uncharacterized protein LOC108662491 isoform X1 [Theobroma cacao]|uniref:Uncharacterized protein LOC108662491 isoform X1 n=1 Tax=Theobroma cacao TaxID=3641 RepID=A0AB32WHP1_THECC|nr:PREDICTED: uncharacterized protein LOC108662491 isoform X1 [Theobroma cacao]
MESSEQEHVTSAAMPAAWEEKAPSPRPHTPYLQGISIPPSPQTFSEYFQDTPSTSLPQDAMEFMMFQLTEFSHLQTMEYAGSLPNDPLPSHQQVGRKKKVLNDLFSDDHITSFSMELAVSSHSKTGVSGKLLPTGPLARQTNAQSGISVSAAPTAVDASQNPQQSKRLSRHQIYRMHVKGKAKFKDLSHQILNEHIKMLNEELLRMTGELKAKNEQLSHLMSENDMLKKENKRLKLPS